MSRDQGSERDDNLLRALGAHGRAEGQHLAELERLATPGSEANGPGTGGKDEVRVREVFAPFDAATRARFVDEILRSTKRAPSNGDAGTHRTETEGAPVSALSTHPRFRQRRRTFVVAAMAGLAVAAAVVLVVRPPDPPVAYALEIRGGDERQRAADQGGSANDMPVLMPSSWLEIHARPARPVGGTTAWAFVRAAGGTDAGAALTARPEISRDGVVRWRGTAGALLGARRGELELRVVIGTGQPPTVEDVFSGGGDPDQQVRLVGRVQVRP